MAVMLFYESGNCRSSCAVVPEGPSNPDGWASEFANRLESDGTITVVDPQLIMPAIRLS